MARLTALVYNWWSLFVRLADPTQHSEAISSRPLLAARPSAANPSQRPDPHRHADAAWAESACREITAFFITLRRIAEQLTPVQRRCRRALARLGAVPQRPPAATANAYTGNVVSAFHTARVSPGARETARAHE
ncbi:MAG: hypothetical protein LJE70_04455 [Chromatiaceae bacterium]|nr:hypothetical protein [Chromatiaceae bacterium]